MPLTFRAETTVHMVDHVDTCYTTTSCRETWVDHLRDLVKGIPTKAIRKKRGDMASVPYSAEIYDKGNSAMAYLWAARVFPDDMFIKTHVKINACVSNELLQHWLTELQPYYPQVKITHVQRPKEQRLEESVWLYFGDVSLEAQGASAKAEIICESDGWEAISAAWWLILFNRIVSCGIPEEEALQMTIAKLISDSYRVSQVWYSSVDREQHVECWNTGKFASFGNWVAQWGIVGASRERQYDDFVEIEDITRGIDVEPYRKIFLD